MIFLLGVFAIYGKVYLASANFKFMQEPLHMNEKEEMPLALPQCTSGVSECTYNATFQNVTSKLHNENDNETQLRQFLSFQQETAHCSRRRHGVRHQSSPKCGMKSTTINLKRTTKRSTSIKETS